VLSSFQLEAPSLDLTQPADSAQNPDGERDGDVKTAIYPRCLGPVSNSVMSITVSKLTGIALLVGASALQGSKSVTAIVSVSHVTRHGRDLHETRVHVMRDHKAYVEEIKQHSAARPTCTQFLAVRHDLYAWS
jgi:hypothetical protein